MTQNSIPLRFILLPLLAIAGVWCCVALHGRSTVEPRREQRDEAEETDSPDALAEWDWMRLHDPKTGEIPSDIRRRELAFAATLPTRESFMSKHNADAILADAEWTARGPFNVGGRTRALAIDATNSSTIIAGGATGGMWRSTDAGASWARATRPDQLPAVSCVTQDPRQGHTDTWYYGTGEYYGSSASIDKTKYTGDGIYKSSDGGRSWNLLKSTLIGSPTTLDNPFEYVWNVAVDPSNGSQDVVYAAVYGAIERSTNGGNTWSDALGGFSLGGAFTDVAVTRNGTVYATLSGNGFPSGIWRSPDGINWVQITPSGWPGSFNRIVIAPAPSNENVVYFLGETPGGGLRVSGSGGTEWHSLWKYTYRSGDGTATGGTWENRSNSLPPASGNFGGFRSQHSYDLVMKVKPDDENTLFIGGTNLYRSTNGFATAARTTWIGGYRATSGWLDFFYPNHHADQQSLAFAPNDPTILYSGNDGGVFRTANALADSITWEPLNHGYLTTQLYALAIDHATPGDNTIVAGMQDNSTWITRSADPTTPWSQVGPGDGAFCAVADSGAAYYVSSQGGRIYRVGLADAGGLAGFARIDPSGGPAYLFVNPFALDPTGSRTLYHVSGATLWRNTDPAGFPLDSSTSSKQLNWSAVNSAGGTVGLLTAIGVSTRNPSHRVYVGSALGAVQMFDGADVASIDPTLVSGANFPDGYVSCVAVDPDDGDKAMAVFSNYGIISLYYTTDAGGSWTPVAGNLEEHADGTGDGPSCRWAAMLHRGSSTIYYVGTSTGLYSATRLDGMNTVWVQEAPSVIGNSVVAMIDVRQSDGLVAVGTHGYGVFTMQLGSAGAPAEDRDAARAMVTLEGNVPNPVRSATDIGFTLGAPAPVRLALYDVAGREVRPLLDAPMLPAGHHTVRLDILDEAGGALPAGLYYYRIEAAGERRARSLLVMP